MIQAFINYAKAFIGKPYVWAGDGSGKKGGFDCSGLVLECLYAFGLYTGSDITADGIRKMALKKSWKEVKTAEEGSLLFFGTEKKIIHVAICIGNNLMIEAGGGGRSSTSIATSTGMVRIRPISFRKDLISIVNPIFEK